MQNRKLGTIGFNDFVKMNCFQLQNGDTLIAGSDGRDDLLIESSEGTKEMNQDDSKFLRAVEKGNGQLKNIYEHIKSSGEISDDLSMLRITYKGNHSSAYESPGIDLKKILLKALKEKKKKFYRNAMSLLEGALNSFSENIIIFKHLTSLNLRIGNYENVINYSAKIISLFPSETKYLFYISFAYYKLGNIQKAIFYSERVYLREPRNLKNLDHLIKLCQKANNQKLAEYYKTVIANLMQK